MRVLLAHGEPPLLASLGEHLRAAGHSVTEAATSADLLELVAAAECDVVLLSRGLASESAEGLGLVDALALAAARPGPVLVLAPSGASLSGVELHEDNPTSIIARLHEFAPASSPRSSAQVTRLSVTLSPVAALVAALAAEKRSGTLDVSIVRDREALRARGAPPNDHRASQAARAAPQSERAILCLRQGRLVDVTFAQQRGDKALARVVALRDPASRFTPGDPDVLARLTEPTEVLLERACERADALSDLAGRFVGGLATTRYVRARHAEEGEGRALTARVFALVRGPTLVTEVLERLPEPDSEVLAALLALEAAGQLRQVRASGDMATIASPEQLPALRAAAGGATGGTGATGFTGPARLILAGSLAELGAIGSLALRLVEATTPDTPPPTTAVPRVAALLLLGEGVRVELVALPTVDAYAPTWPLFVAGARAVIPLRATDRAAVLRACPDAADRVRSAEPRAAPWETATPDELAGLLRASLGVPD